MLLFLVNITLEVEATIRGKRNKRYKDWKEIKPSLFADNMVAQQKIQRNLPELIHEFRKASGHKFNMQKILSSIFYKKNQKDEVKHYIRIKTSND